MALALYRGMSLLSGKRKPWNPYLQPVLIWCEPILQPSTNYQSDYGNFQSLGLSDFRPPTNILLKSFYKICDIVGLCT